MKSTAKKKISIIEVNNMIFDEKSVRQIAKHFKVSESTIRRKIIK
ncbi:MAG: hypothetical protein V4547_18240 [Bacteroidota bacterium]